MQSTVLQVILVSAITAITYQNALDNVAVHLFSYLHEGDIINSLSGVEIYATAVQF